MSDLGYPVSRPADVWTLDQLKRLHHGSVVLDSGGYAWQLDGEHWHMAGHDFRVLPIALLAYGPEAPRSARGPLVVLYAAELDPE